MIMLFQFNIGKLQSTTKLQAFSCDVASSESEVDACIAKAVAEFGEVDILINCAGTSIAAEFEQLLIKDFEQMLRVNVMGSVLPTRVVVSKMKQRGRGHIVFVSSQVAQVNSLHQFNSVFLSIWWRTGCHSWIYSVCSQQMGFARAGRSLTNGTQALQYHYLCILSPRYTHTGLC
jgi:NAD(P)-dependent dehydrogenase (short-subunit alcohol dehydrogenase family)